MALSADCDHRRGVSSFTSLRFPAALGPLVVILATNACGYTGLDADGEISDLSTETSDDANSFLGTWGTLSKGGLSVQAEKRTTQSHPVLTL